MAGSTGLEPATSGVTGRRSNQLNYDPERADADDWLVATSLARQDSADALRRLGGQPSPDAGERRLVGGTGLEPVTAGV